MQQGPTTPQYIKGTSVVMVFICLTLVLGVKTTIVPEKLCAALRHGGMLLDKKIDSKPKSVGATEKTKNVGGSASEERPLEEISQPEESVSKEELQQQDDASFEHGGAGVEEMHLQKDDSAGGCPISCPLRDVMVCARCSHGIFRTFMSACYMRMYQCQHPKEKLELISRHPCTGSAPYLGKMPKPESNLVEPQDEDLILDHIYDQQHNTAQLS